jgi:hypothetical protein
MDVLQWHVYKENWPEEDIPECRMDMEIIHMASLRDHLFLAVGSLHLPSFFSRDTHVRHAHVRPLQQTHPRITLLFFHS